MKTLKLMMFLFYKYYLKGKQTQDIPYISALCAVVIMLIIHLLQIAAIILIFTNKDILLTHDSKLIQYIKVAIYSALVFLIIGFLVKRKDLEVAVYSDEVIKKGNKYLLLYVISSIMILMLLFLWKIFFPQIY